MLTLYEHPLSSYAMKAKIALLEKGLEFEAVVPTGLMNGQVERDFVAASPRGEIPALIDGDTKVFDSTVIMEYLEDKWPTPALLPKTPAARARARMIEDIMDSLYEPNNWGLFEVLRFKRAGGALADKLVAFSRANIAQLQAWLDRQLGGKPWFTGEQFGWADVACAPYVARSALTGNPPPAGSALAGWLERINERPSVSKAIGQMRDVIAAFPDVATMLAQGQIKRQYRDHRLEWMIAAGGIAVVQEGLEKGTIRFSRLPE